MSFKICRNPMIMKLMRNFTTLSETHQQLRDTCRNFAETELKPIASNLDRECIFPKAQIEKLASLGLTGVLISEEYNGAGLDTSALSIAVEELSRGCAGTGAIISIHNALYMAVVDKYGTPAQKKRFILPSVNDYRIGCFALSEPACGSDAANLHTSAVRDVRGWILNGTKAWVTSAYESETAIIFATTNKCEGHNGISAFLVDIPTKGLSLGRKENKMGIRASSTCDIILNNVEVSDDQLLGKQGEGFKIAMSSLDCARIGIASQAVGIAQACLDCAVEYAGNRIAFGKSLLKLQAIQQRIARMALQLEAARLLTREAAFLRDANQCYTQAASMAKVTASEAATSLSHNCVQILGGMGYVSDMPAERHYRDARVTEIYAGPTDIHLLLIADHVAKRYGYRAR